MDDAAFWDLVERSRADDPAAQAASLRVLLVRLPTAELRAFDRRISLQGRGPPSQSIIRQLDVEYTARAGVTTNIRRATAHGDTP